MYTLWPSLVCASRGSAVSSGLVCLYVERRLLGRAISAALAGDCWAVRWPFVGIPLGELPGTGVLSGTGDLSGILIGRAAAGLTVAGCVGGTVTAAYIKNRQRN